MTSELRRSYKVDVKLEPFYSGGAAPVSKNGKLVACACYEDVKVKFLDCRCIWIAHPRSDLDVMTACRLWKGLLDNWSRL